MNERIYEILGALILLPLVVGGFAWFVYIAYEARPERFTLVFGGICLLFVYCFRGKVHPKHWKQSDFKKNLIAGIFAAVIFASLGASVASIIGSWDRSECSPGVPARYC